MQNAQFTSKTDEEFFGAIGRLTISWAQLEVGLDSMVRIIYYGFKGSKIEAEVPRNLKRKIRFLRAAFKTLPIGKTAIDGYLNFLDRVQSAAETRHDIIHGVVIEQVEGSGEATLIRMIKGRNGAVKEKKRKFTTRAILQAALEAQRLGGLILSAANQLYNFINSLTQQAEAKRIGFMKGEFTVPDDFDTMFAEEIEDMFYGENVTSPRRR